MAKYLLAILLSAMFTSCHLPTDTRSVPPYVPYVTDQVMVDTSKVLDDGSGTTIKLEPGRYKLEMTANNDGADVEWVGGSCPKSVPLREATVTCEMSRQGQLVVTNPSVFGLGKQVSVTVRLTRLSS